MLITRRAFLKLIGASFTAGVGVPALALPRDPYVAVGEIVNYIGPHPGGFIGGCVVLEVREWDGVGYPVTLQNNAYGSQRGIEGIFHDFDLADFHREVPADFWHSQANRRRYPNVHTWLRKQRFGETIAQAVAHLNFVSTHGIARIL